MIRTLVRVADIDWERRDPAPGWDPSHIGEMVLYAPTRMTLRFSHYPVARRHRVVVTQLWKSWHPLDQMATLVAASTSDMIRNGVILIPDHVDDATVLTALSHVLAVDGDFGPASVIAFKSLDRYGLVRGPWMTGEAMVPQRTMPPAVCKYPDCPCMKPIFGEQCPVERCRCGYHAAFDPWQLCRQIHPSRGVLVVQAVGKTVWHVNAWRAERYAVHAAVVGAIEGCTCGNCVWPPGISWPDDIPVVRCDHADVPLVAWEIAEEVRAMQVLEREDEGCGRPADCGVDRQTDCGHA